jgi:hypothetical protein
MIRKIASLSCIVFVIWGAGSVCLMAEPANGITEENQTETMMQDHKQRMQRLHVERYEKLQRSPKTITAVLAFNGPEGAHRVEAATNLWSLIQHGLSTRHDIEELLGKPDKKIQENIWHYTLQASQFLEITFDVHGDINQVSLSFKDIAQLNGAEKRQDFRFYEGMLSEKLVRIFGEPSGKKQQGNREIWFYRLDNEGVWKIIINQHAQVIGLFYTIMPPLPKDIVESTRQPSPSAVHRQPISDIEIAISEFKTQPGYRMKAAEKLRPFIKKGMSAHAIEAFLGTPDEKIKDESVWKYDLFYSLILVIHFDAQGHVEKVFP